MQQLHLKNKGFVTLMALLVVSAVGLGVVIWGLSFSVLEVRQTLTMKDKMQFRYATEYCADSVLFLIRQNLQYTGEGSISYLDNALCTYEVYGDDERHVVVQSNFPHHILHIVLAINGPFISIEKWHELPVVD